MKKKIEYKDEEDKIIVLFLKVLTQLGLQNTNNKTEQKNLENKIRNKIRDVNFQNLFLKLSQYDHAYIALYWKWWEK